MLFNKGDPMPSKCSEASNCLCICSVQDYSGCDRNGICQPISIESEMSYYCMKASSFDFTNQYKCMKIEIKDIPLKKENGVLIIGDFKNFEIAEKLKKVLDFVDTETGKTINSLLAEYVVSQNYKSKVKIDRLMQNYVQKNLLEISSWSLIIKLNDKTLGIFGHYDSGIYSDMPDIPSFKHSYNEFRDYNGINYKFDWEFNLNKES
jgi:hypothetical protein